MRRVFSWFFVLAAAGGVYYATQHPEDVKQKINHWIAQLQDTNGILPDSAGRGGSSQQRERIPKQLKASPFDSLDAYARNAPAKVAGNIKTLAAYLQQPTHNELEKARVAYAWIATHILYDARGYSTGSYASEESSASSILKKRVAVCSGYSELFSELLTSMGLEVQTVVGYSKGYSYYRGKRLTDTDHAWNVVKIDGRWRLMDATWGSGYVQTEGKKLVAKQKFDPYWFDTDPKQFIFTHLPEDAQWQLLPGAITLAQYQVMPQLSDDFFKLGFHTGDVFDAAVAGNLKEAPKTYSSSFPLIRNDFPLTRGLEKEKEYTFNFESDYAEEAAVIDGEKWIKFTKAGNRFTATFTPVSTNIRVCVKNNWYDRSYESILQYQLTGKKKPRVI